MWKTHPIYNNYQVSTIGRVRSITRKVQYSDGHYQQIKGQLIKPFISKWGYAMVKLTYHKHRISKQVNDLVAETFIPNPHNFKETHHKNYNKLDNSITNLVWTSRKNNMQDQSKHYHQIYLKTHSNVIDDNSKSYMQVRCPLCNESMANTSIICSQCRNKYNKSHINGYKITIEQLIAIIEYYNGNLTKTGKLFDVTSNTIVKKLKLNGLPYHSKDYQNY